MTAAVFRATIHGLRTVPSRKVVQVIVEAAIEELPLIARIAEHGAWVALARIEEREVMPAESNEPQPETKPERSPTPAARAPRERKPFDELPIAQQAGIICNEPPFWLFLSERFNLRDDKRDAESAAIYVRNLCGVTSRSEIANNKDSRAAWSGLLLAYRLWEREPSVVPA